MGSRRRNDWKRALAACAVIMAVCAGPVGMTTALAGVRISELMASNDSTLTDEDGDYSDWIELVNGGGSAVDLAGFRFVTGGRGEVVWEFPQRLLGPSERTIVWASGKNRRSEGAGELHTSFTLPKEGGYLALVKPDGTRVANLAGDRFPPQRTDISWGFGDVGTERTIEATPNSAVFRDNYAQVRNAAGGSFTVTPNVDTIDAGGAGVAQQRYLWFDYSGALPEIAGGRVTSARLEWEGSPRDTLGSFAHGVGIFPVPADGGEFGAGAIFGDGGAGAMAAYYAANNPAGIMVGSSQGKVEAIWDARALVAGWLESPSSPTFGRFLIIPEAAPHFIQWGSPALPTLTITLTEGLDVPAQAVFFSEPSPGQPEKPGVLGFVAATRFDVGRGIFESPFDLSITCGTPGAKIFYTENGEDPAPGAAGSALYTEPIAISETSIIRAGAFIPGWKPYGTVTQSYIFPADVSSQDHAHGLRQGFPDSPVNNQVYRLGFRTRPTPDLTGSIRALPVWSLGISAENFSDPKTGIYTNSGNASRAGLERPASVEILNFPGAAATQIDCGARIRGGFSRRGANPKHSFRFAFRKKYGSSKLRFPLFGTGGTDTFDKIDLRTSQNQSWALQNSLENSLLREVAARDAQAALGGLHTRSGYVHLFINGHYWGVYMTQERSDNEFAESYLGGDAENYDVLKSSANTPPAGTGLYKLQAKNGNTTSWETLYNSSVALRETPDITAYEALQGDLLDPAHLADYMLTVFTTGSFDGPLSTFVGSFGTNNWFSIRDRSGGSGAFRFLMHDTEHGMGSDRFTGAAATGGIAGEVRSTDRTGPWAGRGNNHKGETMHDAISDLARSNPQYLHENLCFIDEYRLTFADRAYHHLLRPGGALTDEAFRQRIAARAEALAPAIVAESAKWGTADLLSPAQWAGERDSISEWFRVGDNISLIEETPGPGRAAVIIQQLKNYRDEGRALPLYPQTDVPEVAIIGNTATFSTSAFYRVDGADPRIPGSAFGSEVTLEPGQTLTVRARDASNGEWSAMHIKPFHAISPPEPGDVILSEIYFHPGAGESEFLEILNPSEIDTYNLGGLIFTDGIHYEFPENTSISPGQRLVLQQASYSGKLSNNGERLTLRSPAGTTIIDLPYEEVEGGQGYSLELEGTPQSSLNLGGTPGAAALQTQFNGSSEDLLDIITNLKISTDRELTYTRTLGVIGITVEVESSTDLKTWSAVSPMSKKITRTGGTTEDVTLAEISGSYFRLRLSAP